MRFYIRRGLKTAVELVPYERLCRLFFDYRARCGYCVSVLFIPFERFCRLFFDYRTRCGYCVSVSFVPFERALPFIFRLSHTIRLFLFPFVYSVRNGFYFCFYRFLSERVFRFFRFGRFMPLCVKLSYFYVEAFCATRASDGMLALRFRKAEVAFAFRAFAVNVRFSVAEFVFCQSEKSLN